MAGKNHSNSKRSDSTGLGVLLEELSNLLAEHEGGNSIHVFSVVDLDILSSLHENGSEVGSNSGVGDSHVLR